MLRFIYITTKTRRLAGFINLIFFCKDQMAKTNAKIPSFHRNVNEPLMRKANRISVDSSKIGAHKWHWVTRSVTRLGNFLDFGQLFKAIGYN